MYRAGVALVWLALATNPKGGLPVDAALVTTSGEPRTLSSYRGKPVVLFYEDRGSVKLNQEFKNQLFLRGKEHNLLDAAWVVPVANLEAYNWFPARAFASSGVKDAEIAAEKPMLVDWEGTLSSPPWNLPAKTSSILLLDQEGLVVFRVSGRLSAKELEEFFSILARLLSVP